MEDLLRGSRRSYETGTPAKVSEGVDIGHILCTHGSTIHSEPTDGILEVDRIAFGIPSPDLIDSYICLFSKHLEMADTIT